MKARRRSKRSKHLNGTPETHSSIASTFLDNSKELLDHASSCDDLARVKWKLGAASENIVWAPRAERAALQVTFDGLNARVNRRLKASCRTPIGTDLGRARRR